MYRRLGRTAEAKFPYEKALAPTQQDLERQFLQERIRGLKQEMQELSIFGRPNDYLTTER